MINRNWFDQLQAAAGQYPHLAWAIDKMTAEYSSAQGWKPIARSLSQGCAEQQGRIEELQAIIERVKKVELKNRLADPDNYYRNIRADFAADLREAIYE